MRRASGILAILVITAAAVACSSPLNDDNDQAAPTTTATSVSEPAEAAADTAIVTSSAASTPPLDTPEPETTGPTATRRATTPRATPTGEPLPLDGAELTVDGDSLNQIIAGDDNGRTLYGLTGEQLVRSSDGGHTWTEAGRGPFGPLIVAVNEPNVLYAGDKGSCGLGVSDFAFQRTSDAGRTWTTVEENANIQPMLAHESSTGAVLYGTECGLQVSTDGGDTWERIIDLNGEEVFQVITQRSDPMEQLLVVAATEGGTGRLFLFELDEPAQPVFAGGLTQFWGDAAVDWRDDRIILVNAHRAGVSDDGGLTWEWSRAGLEHATYEQDPLFEGIPAEPLDTPPGFKHARIDPTDPDRILIGGSHGAFVSLDGGASWQSIGEPEPVTGIAISAVTNRVFISYAGGTRLWELPSIGR